MFEPKRGTIHRKGTTCLSQGRETRLFCKDLARAFVFLVRYRFVGNEMPSRSEFQQVCRLRVKAGALDTAEGGSSETQTSSSTGRRLMVRQRLVGLARQPKTSWFEGAVRRLRLVRAKS